MWGSRKFRTLLLSAVWGRGGGTAGVVSPNTFKRLHDFSHGVLDHVKSYYNSSLWQTDSKGTSVLSTPIVAGNPKQMQNGSAGMPNQLKEAETLKRPSSETETEMPEMSEVSPSLQNGNKQSKQLVSVGLSNKGLSGNPHELLWALVACSFVLLPQRHLLLSPTWFVEFVEWPQLGSPPSQHPHQRPCVSRAFCTQKSQLCELWYKHILAHPPKKTLQREHSRPGLTWQQWVRPGSNIW